MKKTIFALLLVVALVAVLAIPAMANTTETEYWIYHCQCGAIQFNEDQTIKSGSAAACKEGCDHAFLAWEPWDGVTGSITKSGNYYLTKDYTHDELMEKDDGLGPTMILNLGSTSGSYAVSTEVLYFNLDLNGYDITSGGRFIRVDGDKHAVHLTLSNSNPDKVGTVKITSKISDKNAAKGAIVWVRKGNTGSTVEIFGGNYDASGWEYTGSDTNPQGAAVYVESGTEFTMSGGTLTGTKQTNKKYQGGAVFVNTSAEFNMYGGTIYGGTAATGGAVWTQGTVKIAGNARIEGGATVTNGSGVFVNNGTAEVSGNAVITGGKASSKGGGIIALAGTLTIKDNAQVTGNNCTATNGGGVHVQDTATLKVAGNAQIKNNTNANGVSNVYLASGRTIAVDGLTSDASIGVTMATPSTFVSGAADATNNFFSDNADYTVTAAGALEAVKAFEVNGTKTNWSGVGDATEAKLVADLYAQVPVSSNMTLDLNGNDISRVNIAEDVTLQVYDSTTSDYVVNVTDRDYGVIKEIIGNVEGLAPHFVNGEKHRYLTLNVAGEGYSFHRFYLAVTHSVLRADYSGLNYKTMFKCNDKVAALVSAYGLNLTVGETVIPVTETTFSGAVAAGENQRTTAITGLNNGNAADYMTKVQTINAYITVNGKTITSAVKTTSMKDMILRVMDNQWAGMSNGKKDNLAAIYNTYGAAAGMDSWGDSILELKKYATEI